MISYFLRNFTWAHLEFHLENPHFLLIGCLFIFVEQLSLLSISFCKMSCGFVLGDKKATQRHTLLPVQALSSRCTLTNPGRTWKEATSLSLAHGTHLFTAEWFVDGRVGSEVFTWCSCLHLLSDGNWNLTWFGRFSCTGYFSKSKTCKGRTTCIWMTPLYFYYWLIIHTSFKMCL